MGSSERQGSAGAGEFDLPVQNACILMKYKAWGELRISGSVAQERNYSKNTVLLYSKTAVRYARRLQAEDKQMNWPGHDWLKSGQKGAEKQSATRVPGCLLIQVPKDGGGAFPWPSDTWGNATSNISGFPRL